MEDSFSSWALKCLLEFWRNLQYSLQLWKVWSTHPNSYTYINETNDMCILNNRCPLMWAVNPRVLANRTLLVNRTSWIQDVLLVLQAPVDTMFLKYVLWKFMEVLTRPQHSASALVNARLRFLWLFGDSLLHTSDFFVWTLTLNWKLLISVLKDSISVVLLLKTLGTFSALRIDIYIVDFSCYNVVFTLVIVLLLDKWLSLFFIFFFFFLCCFRLLQADQSVVETKMKRSHGMFIDRKEGKVETNASKRQERFLEKQQESCTTSKTFTQLGQIKTRDQRCNLKEQKVSYSSSCIPAWHDH